MLHSRFVVRSRLGEVLGIFPSPLADHAAAMRDLIDAYPGAAVESTVTSDSPCRFHPAYEADNCPACSD